MKIIDFVFTVLAVIGVILACYLGTIFRKMLPEFGMNTGAKLVLASAIYVLFSAIVYVLLAFGAVR